MANELAVLIENRLAKKGWSVTDLVRETGLTAGTVAELLGPRELPGMPDGDTVERLATALGIPPRRVVLRAVEACGMATSWAGDREHGLRTASDEELMRELRRRLLAGRSSGDARRRRLSHLALIGGALAG
jgi:transcriptional regulator with XRE-family HTH domain